MIMGAAGLALCADIASRLAARAWLSTDVDLGVVTLMLRIHRTPTFFGLSFGWLPLWLVLNTALLGFVLAVALVLDAPAPFRRFGALLVGAGALANVVELLCCGVTDIIQVHVSAWSSPIFNLGDVNLVVGALLLFLA